MMRKLLAVAAGLGVTLAGSQALAQPAGAEFGRQGEFIFSADRLFGFFAFTSDKVDVPDANAQSHNITTNQTSFSFFWGSNGSFFPTLVQGGGGAFNLSPGTSTFYSVPRLGFDYTIIDNLTIGGNLILFFTVGSSNNEHIQRGNATTDNSVSNPGVLVFGFAPRVGYIINVSPLLSLWLRGGLSYYRGQAKDVNNNVNPQVTTTDSADTFGIDFDPQLVISPVPHFAFTVGPALDVGFGGHLTHDVQTGSTDQNTSVNYSQVNFAVNAGLLGWFGP
jgi:hypothetical protein